MALLVTKKCSRTYLLRRCPGYIVCKLFKQKESTLRSTKAPQFIPLCPSWNKRWHCASLWANIYSQVNFANRLIKFNVYQNMLELRWVTNKLYSRRTACTDCHEKTDAIHNFIGCGIFTHSNLLNDRLE